MEFVLDPQAWAEKQFGECQLGNRLRVPRLTKMATQIAANPSASFPKQMDMWSDLKAAYRLFAAEGVTFEAIVEPHWRQTRQRPPGRYLVLGDTTELDFGIRRKEHLPGLHSLGNGTGYGFLLHSGLMVEADSEEIVGLTGQVIHYRKAAPQKENTAQRLKRERESEIWGQVIDQTGPPPKDAQFIHVLDRGADNFEVYCHCRQQRADWVVRVNQRQRRIQNPAGETQSLNEYLATLPWGGTYKLSLRARPQHAARTASLEVRFGPLRVLPPKHHSHYLDELKPDAIPMGVVWVREVQAPKGVSPLEWVLYHSWPIERFDEARQVIGFYEKRPLIDEWHKALKTGCQAEQRQLKQKDRLEPMVGLMSVQAVRLLQLKRVAQTEPERRATDVVPREYVETLAAARRLDHKELTAYEFYREMAKLGGFLGRRRDGEPGWVTLWRGWETLHLLVQGAQLAAKRQASTTKPG